LDSLKFVGHVELFAVFHHYGVTKDITKGDAECRGYQEKQKLVKRKVAEFRQI
jgi:hypothetical protein